MAVRPGRGGEPAEQTERGGYYLEFQRLGNTVKVSAIDPRTGTEASTLGPASAGRDDLGRAAVRKLEYILARRKGGER